MWLTVSTRTLYAGVLSAEKRLPNWFPLTATMVLACHPAYREISLKRQNQRYKTPWRAHAKTRTSLPTGTNRPLTYWFAWKIQKMYDKIVQLKVTAPDGKLRLTDDNWRKNLAIRLSPSSAQWTSLPLPKNCRSSLLTTRSSSNCKKYLFFRQRCESIVAFSF